ncbi:MAG: DUF4197 domain-containing protein [Bacteroidales bacterium]|nr:DUF4197 domain-containing protein [Bacteroidales bacterium]
MKRIIYLLLILATIIVVSCEELSDGLGELTTEEVVQGLKTALAVGTDSSTTALAAVNGYYGNKLLKIPLPPEAESVRTSINTLTSRYPVLASTFNLDQHFENIVKSVNMAAESAAKEAAPIFKESITSLSITDAWDILNGINPASKKSGNADFDSTAATNYFKATTSEALTGLYSPKIDNALGKDLGLGFSANDAWDSFKSAYNTAYSSATSIPLVGSAVEDELDPVSTESIGEFCTGIALNGLFHKVGEEEIKIRRDPLEWALTAVGDILERVFGGG